MELKELGLDFCVCQVENFSQVNLDEPFTFTGKTDEECSLVCQKQSVPPNVIACASDWMGFRIQGVLDFSLVGILSTISTILAHANVSIYAISTFNTDYIFIKQHQWDIAQQTLLQHGYTIVH